MAALESLLYDVLTQDETLKGLLATYRDRPAVFEGWAPDNTDSGWSGEQTPRIEFAVVRQEDPERHVAGQVSFSVVDEIGSMDRVAEIELRLRSLLDGATFRPDEGTVSLRWSRADMFDQVSDFRGLEAVYDLIAWPVGTTYEPDPVTAMREWATKRWSGVQVDPGVWTPSDTTPALYWRMTGVAGYEPRPWGAWLRVRLQCHVLARSPDVRLSWVRRVVEALAVDGSADLTDGTRLEFLQLSADSQADPLRTGQITLEARMGVLRAKTMAPPVNRAVVSGDVSMEVEVTASGQVQAE